MEYGVTHNQARNRFEVTVEGNLAYAAYRMSGEVMHIDHTYVPSPVEGRGVGAALVKAALDYAREHGLRVAPDCFFVGIYIDRHPDYRDLLA